MIATIGLPKLVLAVCVVAGLVYFMMFVARAADALERIADALERIADALEDKDSEEEGGAK